MNKFRTFLLKNRITPKWVIFALDLAICTGASLAAIYIAEPLISTTNFWYSTFCSFSFSAIFILTFKTYDGIIRYSDFKESVRGISAVLSSFVSMLTINLLAGLYGNEPIISTETLVVYFFIASFFMVGYRVWVKVLYNESVKEESLTSVIIYGAGLNASLLMKTIEQISINQYKVIALIDTDEKIIGKTIDNVRVYPVSYLSDAIKFFNVKILFLSNSNADIKNKNKVVDECLEKHVKVMSVPPVKAWIQGHLNLSQLQEVKIEELLGRPSIILNNPEVVNFIYNGLPLGVVADF